jgi:hypothetical protein
MSRAAFATSCWEHPLRYFSDSAPPARRINLVSQYGVQAAFIETSCFMAAGEHPVRSGEAPAIKKYSILATPGLPPGGDAWHFDSNW